MNEILKFQSDFKEKGIAANNPAEYAEHEHCTTHIHTLISQGFVMRHNTSSLCIPSDFAKNKKNFLIYKYL